MSATAWSQLLSEQGATFDADGMPRFDGEADSASLLDGDLLCALDHYAVLGCVGPDAGKFLQGQLTCDVDAVDGAQTRLGAYCTHQGRMIVSFRLGRLDPNTLALRLHRGLQDRAQQALGKFIVFSKAELQPLPYRVLGLSGPHAASLIDSVLGVIPAEPGAQGSATGEHADTQVIRLGEAQFELWVPEASAPALWQALAGQDPAPKPAGPRPWQLQCIRLGLGEVWPGAEEQFIPQDLNYQLTGAVSFDKGCYTGQEVVARMHYRGKLKRHMYRLAVAGATPPAPATALRDGDDKRVGEVIMAATSTGEDCELLAVVNDQALDGDLFVAEDSPRPARALSLPYAITSGTE